MSRRRVERWVLAGVALVGAGVAWLAWPPGELPAAASPREMPGELKPSPDAETWLLFRPLPGARRLCSGHVLGSTRTRDRAEITFTLYASRREPSDVAHFYAEIHHLPWEPHQTTLRVRPDDGPHVLSVHPVSSAYPTCDVPPGEGDRTIIVVSSMLRSGP
jgi:hypothetical protein